MLNFTTPIQIGKPVPRISKLEIVHVDDRDTCIVLELKLWGPNDVPYPLNQIVAISDNGPSNVLRVNASPTTILDQFQVLQVTLSGTPYTTLSNAWHNATGGKAARKRAVEALMVSTGAIGPEFAGT